MNDKISLQRIKVFLLWTGLIRVFHLLLPLYRGEGARTQRVVSDSSCQYNGEI